MQPLITGAEARAADEAAVAAGDSWDGLLARAGHGLATGALEELRGRSGGVYARIVHVVVGKGDNGGDGWVAARHLRDRGAHVTVHALHGVDVDASAHTTRARARWIDDGGPVVEGLTLPDDERPWWSGAYPDLVVDALVGTGVDGALRGVVADAAFFLQSVRDTVPVVSADVPSGIDADTGLPHGPHVRADRTVTFGARKRGLALHPGAAAAGRVDVVDLGFRWHRAARRLGPSRGWVATEDLDVGRNLELTAQDDKRSRGRVLVVAGSQRYAGAGALAAATAVRAGAGLVTLATSGPTETVRMLEPAVMAVSLPVLDGDPAGGPSPAAVDAVVGLADDVDVVVLGPGCGYGAGTRAIAEALLDHGVGVVLDADGCNVFRDDVDALATHRGGLVLTPQHRELARLLGRDDADEVLRERHAAVPELAERLPGVVVVGKGPGTVVAQLGEQGLQVGVVTSGGPALGSGGTGDVLAGLVGGRARLLGAGAHATSMGGWEETVEAVHLHGMLGDRAGAAAADRATAQDLLHVLPGVLAERQAAWAGRLPRALLDRGRRGPSRVAGRAWGPRDVRGPL